jgi:hypothetical protein
VNNDEDDSNTLHAYSANDMAASKMPACRTLSAELQNNLHGDCQRVFCELPRCLPLFEVKILKKYVLLPTFPKGVLDGNIDGNIMFSQQNLSSSPVQNCIRRRRKKPNVSELLNPCGK